MVLMVNAIVFFLVLCGCLARAAPPKGAFDGRVSSSDEAYFSNNNEEDEEMNVVRQVESVDLDKIQYSHSRFFDVINGESFVLVKTVRHRNKRFSSYLTLCPFKICSMGRKRLRSRRYIKPIRAPAQDNEGT